MDKIVFILLFSVLTSYAQEKVNNDFYRFTLPKGTDSKIFNQGRENNSVSDSYKISEKGNIKYIFFLLSNKLNDVSDEISLYNYREYLIELTDIEILSADEYKNYVCLGFKYDGSKVNGYIFMNKTNDILNRFVFMIPNIKDYDEKYMQEIYAIVDSIDFLKKTW